MDALTLLRGMLEKGLSLFSRDPDPLSLFPSDPEPLLNTVILANLTMVAVTVPQ